MGLLHDGAASLAASANLRRSLANWLVIGLATSVGGTDVVLHLARPASSGWVAVGLAWWLFVCVFVVGGVAWLVTPEGKKIDYLGIPNGLTAIRAWACFPLFLCSALSFTNNTGLWIWIFVGGAVGALDILDGFVARQFGPITALGKAIDPAMDVLFFSVAAVGSVLLSMLPLWLMALIVLRYLGPMLVTPFVFALGKRPELVHTKWGRRNTGATGIVLVALAIARLTSGSTNVVALVVGLPLLAPTMLLYFRDLIVRVSGAPKVR